MINNGDNIDTVIDNSDNIGQLTTKEFLSILKEKYNRLITMFRININDLGVTDENERRDIILLKRDVDLQEFLSAIPKEIDDTIKQCTDTMLACNLMQQKEGDFIITLIDLLKEITERFYNKESIKQKIKAVKNAVAKMMAINEEKYLDKMLGDISTVQNTLKYENRFKSKFKFLTIKLSALQGIVEATSEKIAMLEKVQNTSNQHTINEINNTITKQDNILVVLRMIVFFTNQYEDHADRKKNAKLENMIKKYQQKLKNFNIINKDDYVIIPEKYQQYKEELQYDIINKVKDHHSSGDRRTSAKCTAAGISAATGAAVAGYYYAANIIGKNISDLNLTELNLKDHVLGLNKACKDFANNLLQNNTQEVMIATAAASSFVLALLISSAITYNTAVSINTTGTERSKDFKSIKCKLY